MTFEGACRWQGEDLYKIYEKAQTPRSWHVDLFKHAADHRIDIFSSPFSCEGVDFLERLKVPFYKIASLEIIWLDLISKCARTGKPLIISTGLATSAEIEAAVTEALVSGLKEKQIALLKCSTSYPAHLEDANLLTLKDMKGQWPRCHIGYSDHTRGIACGIIAATLGAEVIEKHVTLRRESIDGKFSLMPDYFKSFVRSIKAVPQCIGGIQYGPTERERKNLILRRSRHVIDGTEESYGLRQVCLYNGLCLYGFCSSPSF